MNPTHKFSPLALEALQLLADQKQEWPLAAANYEGLKKAEHMDFPFGDFKVVTQFNPERIRSTTAKVDEQTIASRACFLCDGNLPFEQRLIRTIDDYKIMVNPFPIFHQHLTISSRQHTDQRILSSFRSMLRLSSLLEGFTLFYNGPECGASAPDHLHFQGVERGDLPVEADFETLKQRSDSLFYRDETISVYHFSNYLREVITLESSSEEELVRWFEQIYHFLHAAQPDKVEPMLNVVVTARSGMLAVHLFPRKMSRPAQFYATGDEQLLVGPASVELSGLFILPRKVDFEKITSADVVSVLEQVSVGPELTEQLKHSLQQWINNNQSA